MKLPAGACVVVSYHYVRDSSRTRFARLNGLVPDAFEFQVGRLAHLFEMPDYGRFLAAVDGTQELETAAVLTFDDGLVDHYESVFPALQERRLPGIFFVSPDCNGATARVLNVQKTQLLLATLGGERLLREVEEAVARTSHGRIATPPQPVLYRYDDPAARRAKQLLNYELPYDVVDPLLEALFTRHIGDSRDVARELYMTEPMIREMSRAGMTFGFHTHRHRVLSRLTPDAQRVELNNGVAWIRDLTGQATVPFCYPHGHALAYTADTVDAVRDGGYSIAFTAVRALARPGVDRRFEIPRFDTCDVAATLGAEPAVVAAASGPEVTS